MRATKSKTRGLSILIVPLGALAILPFVRAMLFAAVSIHCPDVVPTGDSALLELQVIRAMGLEQLLGPYSQHGWNHPGPIYSYLILPIYWLFGQTWGAYLLGAKLIALTAAIVIVVVVVLAYGKSDRELAYSLLLVSVIFFWTNLRFLSSEWNPYVVLLPYLLLLILSGMIAAGQIGALPAASVAFLIVVQTWLGLGLVCVSIFAASMICYFFPSLAARLGLVVNKSGRPLISLCVAAIIFTITWFPTLYEEVTRCPGNISGMYQSFSMQRDTHPVLDAAVLTLRLASLECMFRAESIADNSDNAVALLFGVLQVLLLMMTHQRSVKKKAYYRVALSLLGFLSLLCAFVSLRHMAGQFFPAPNDIHMVYWISVIGVVNWAVIGAEMIDRLKEAILHTVGDWYNVMVASAGLLLFGVCGGAAYRVSGYIQHVRDLTGYPGPCKSIIDPYGIYVLERPLAEYLQEHSFQRVLIIPSQERWATTAGLALRLYKRGIHFSVDKRWLFQYGNAFRERGDEELRILVLDETSRVRNEGFMIAQYSPKDGAKLPHDAGRTQVYANPPK